MSDLEHDRALLEESIKSETSAFEHHAKIMGELESTGFKPNPVPQVGFEQPSPPPAKACFYLS